MPVSRTIQCRITPPAAPLSGICSTLTATSPRSVNLIAFCTRLRRIWRMRRSSPTHTGGRSSWARTVRRSPFSAAGTFMVETTVSSRRRSANGRLLNCSWPASILEKSRISLRMPSRLSAELRTACRSLRWSGSRSRSSASRFIPMMAFMGVRISWLMLARKVLFAWLAASAASLAASRSRVRCATSSSRNRSRASILAIMSLNPSARRPNSSRPCTGARTS